MSSKYLHMQPPKEIPVHWAVVGNVTHVRFWTLHLVALAESMVALAVMFSATGLSKLFGGVIASMAVNRSGYAAFVRDGDYYENYSTV